MANNSLVLQYLKSMAGVNSYGKGGGPAYNPHRDLVNLFVISFHEVLEDLVTEDMAPDIAKDLDDAGIETSELLDCYNKCADMINMFVGHGKKTIDECAKASGYAECDHRVKNMVERMLGRYAIAEYFYSIRDVTCVDEEPNEYTMHLTLERCMLECKSALDGVETEWAKAIKAHRKEVNSGE